MAKDRQVTVALSISNMGWLSKKEHTATPPTAPISGGNSSSIANPDTFGVHNAADRGLTATASKFDDEERIVGKYHLDLPPPYVSNGLEESRRCACEDQARVQRAALQKQPIVKGGLWPVGAPMMSLAEKAKFQTEVDVQDEAMEGEVDDNNNQLGGTLGRLNLLAKSQGSVVNQGERTVERLKQKSEAVHTQIDRNTHRLDKIK